jgi:hypothetical protein
MYGLRIFAPYVSNNTYEGVNIMAKNKNKAKPKASRFNAEVAEDNGASTLDVKNINSNGSTKK